RSHYRYLRASRSDVPVDYLCLFFFQAEDGIRDFHVTGVQTCALPISRTRRIGRGGNASARISASADPASPGHTYCVSCAMYFARSEERRVGKECRSQWSP